MKKIHSHTISKEDAAQFDMLYPILRTVFDEVKEFSKKKQDGALNALKVKMTNKILSKVKTLLSNDPAAEFLELLDDVNLPTNSDAVLIIAQFRSAMIQFKQKHHGHIKGLGDRWFTPDSEESTSDDLF
jgi:hypothetical protein